MLEFGFLKTLNKGVIISMEVERLIALNDKISSLKAKADQIGKFSLYMIKKSETQKIDLNQVRDLSVKINYLAHEIYDELNKAEN